MTHLSQSRQKVWILLLVLFSMAAFSLTALAQTPRKLNALDEPLLRDYRGVQIGWLTEDVRKKLGNPSDKSDEQDMYVFNEKEIAQILYDKATHKVIAISIDFTNGAQNPITPQQVFGAEIDANPDGSKYRLVRYPKAGFWLSYNKTAGNTPMITVTLQRM